MGEILVNKNVNSLQTQAIKDLKKLIVPELFDENSNSSYNEEIKGWILENENSFSKDEFIDYFVNLNTNVIVTNNIIKPIGEDEDCDCNKSEDYCRWNTDCSTITCESSSRGCGFLWNSTCNGICN